MNSTCETQIFLLSDAELNERIATILGWSQIENVHTMSIFGHWVGYPPVFEIGKKEALPDYCHNLNAMHEAEKMLTDAQYTIWEDSVWEFVTLDNDWLDVPTAGGGSIKLPAKRGRLTSPSSRQRAEAFALTIEASKADSVQERNAGMEHPISEKE